MVIKIDNEQSIPVLSENISCIGYFDGVHLGHRQLIDSMLVQANNLSLKSAVICFEPSPDELIKKKNCQHLLTYEDRNIIFNDLGIDYIIVINFDEKLMKLSSRDFVDDYLNKLNIQKLICGFDFSFGYLAKGNYDSLTEYGGFDVEVIPEYQYQGQKVSSTRIRNALLEGDFKLAKSLLGYDYIIKAQVINCFQKGYKWQIQAKNINDKLIKPKDGIYSAELQIKDGIFYFLSTDRYDKDDMITFNTYNYEIRLL